MSLLYTINKPKKRCNQRSIRTYTDLIRLEDRYIGLLLNRIKPQRQCGNIPGRSFAAYRENGLLPYSIKISSTLIKCRDLLQNILPCLTPDCDWIAEVGRIIGKLKYVIIRCIQAEAREKNRIRAFLVVVKPVAQAGKEMPVLFAVLTNFFQIIYIARTVALRDPDQSTDVPLCRRGDDLKYSVVAVYSLYQRR